MHVLSHDSAAAIPCLNFGYRNYKSRKYLFTSADIKETFSCALHHFA